MHTTARVLLSRPGKDRRRAARKVALEAAVQGRQSVGRPHRLVDQSCSGQAVRQVDQPVVELVVPLGSEQLELLGLGT
jgi:hypothetical protein